MREGLHKIVSTDETIVAISTPIGRSGIGVVRISGGEAGAIARHDVDQGAFELRDPEVLQELGRGGAMHRPRMGNDAWSEPAVIVSPRSGLQPHVMPALARC